MRGQEEHRLAGFSLFFFFKPALSQICLFSFVCICMAPLGFCVSFFFFFSPLSNHLSAKNQIKQSDLADGFVIKLSFSAGFNTNRSKLDFQMCLCTRFLPGLRDSSVRDGMAASRHTRMPTEELGVDLEWRSHQRLTSEVVKETVGLVSWMRGGEALVAEKGEHHVPSSQFTQSHKWRETRLAADPGPS